MIIITTFVFVISHRKNQNYKQTCALYKILTFLTKIADEARHFDNQGEIFLCGDWNSRVGLMSDTVERTGLDRFVDLPDDNDFFYL